MDACSCRGALFLIPGGPGACHRGGASAPGQRLGLSPWWVGVRKRESTTWAEAKVTVTHFTCDDHSLVSPELRDPGEAFGCFGIALLSGMCGDAFFDCSQRHLLPGLCLRALITAFLTSYFWLCGGLYSSTLRKLGVASGDRLAMMRLGKARGQHGCPSVLVSF